MSIMFSDNGKVLVHISDASHVKLLSKNYMLQVNRECRKYIALAYN
jgi:hypothetical protein